MIKILRVLLFPLYLLGGFIVTLADGLAGE